MSSVIKIVEELQARGIRFRLEAGKIKASVAGKVLQYSEITHPESGYGIVTKYPESGHGIVTKYPESGYGIVTGYPECG